MIYLYIKLNNCRNMFQRSRIVEHRFKNFIHFPLSSLYPVRKLILYQDKSNYYFNTFQRWKTAEHCFKNCTPFSVHLTHTSRGVACWKCGTENTSNLYCQSCNVLQEPDYEQTYFDLFNLQLSFNINSTELVSKYHKLQIAFHPDKHSTKSEKEKEISENYSTLINKAYSTLSNPLQRGLYILKVKGSPVDDESVSSNQRELFIDILKWNDDISLVRNPKDFAKLTKKLTQIISDLTKEISEAFEKNDVTKASILLNKMKYYTNVSQKLKVRKQNLGISG